MNEIPSIDDFRAVFLKYTEKAFRLLPKIANPNILDIGCGTGVCTIKLASLTDGIIIGMDIDEIALTSLNDKIRKADLFDQIITINGSLINSGFERGCFDIIWAEGVLHLIGYKKGFKACYELLKPDGYLVIAETIDKVNRKKSLIIKSGFELYNQVIWEKGCWWKEYYEPLEKCLDKLYKEGVPTNSFSELIKHENEIAMVKTNVSQTDTAHYILKKMERQLKSNRS
jgi:cyclopropane fatty-acyl-phospholipid synthase-like methyltransferase